MNKKFYLVMLGVLLLPTIGSAYAAYSVEGMRAAINNSIVNLALVAALLLSIFIINTFIQRYISKGKEKIIFIRELAMVIMIVLWGAAYNRTVFSVDGNPIDYKIYGAVATAAIILAGVLIALRLKKVK